MIKRKYDEISGEDNSNQKNNRRAKLEEDSEKEYSYQEKHTLNKENSEIEQKIVLEENFEKYLIF